jgi:hypothetical protein
MFYIDLVSKVICELKRGKAAGLDFLTAEHLKNCGGASRQKNKKNDGLAIVLAAYSSFPKQFET